MFSNKQETQSFSLGDFVWWIGVAEDRNDPKKLGRIRVRLLGYHTKDKIDIPTEDLFWAYPLQPIISGAMNGIGFSPTGVVEGTWCIGFFRDGHSAQDPVIIGTLGGIPNNKNPSEGFYDPNGKYPKNDFMGEPDTNRLARNEKIDETIVDIKRKALDKDIPKALGDGAWSEKETPYAARYPYNHVRETESGHVEEWDDTEGSERYHRYHKSGGFIEIHPDGTEVRKIKKDKYEIVLGDEYLHVKGNVNIKIDGDANILVDGNTRLETKGDKDEYVHGNYQLKVGGTTKMESGVRTYIDAPRVDLNLPESPKIKF